MFPLPHSRSQVVPLFDQLQGLKSYFKEYLTQYPRCWSSCRQNRRHCKLNKAQCWAFFGTIILIKHLSLEQPNSSHNMWEKMQGRRKGKADYPSGEGPNAISSQYFVSHTSLPDADKSPLAAILVVLLKAEVKSGSSNYLQTSLIWKSTKWPHTDFGGYVCIAVRNENTDKNNIAIWK